MAHLCYSRNRSSDRGGLQSGSFSRPQSKSPLALQSWLLSIAATWIMGEVCPWPGQPQLTHGHGMSQYIDGLRRCVAAFKDCQSFQVRSVVKSQRSVEVHKSQFSNDGWSTNRKVSAAVGSYRYRVGYSPLADYFRCLPVIRDTDSLQNMISDPFLDLSFREHLRSAGGHKSARELSPSLRRAPPAQPHAQLHRHH
jgi:hypothetical protein